MTLMLGCFRRTYFLALFLLACPAFTQVFTDTQENRFEDAITQLAQAGLLQGYPDGSFRPEAFVTRAEYASLIAAQTLSLAAVSEACFADVPPDAWYAPAICAASEAGLVSGYADGRFLPDQFVSYAEALTIGLRAFGFLEARQAEPWYAPYVQFAHYSGVVSKYSYFPESVLSRGAMADLLYRMLELQGGRFFARGRLSPGCSQPPPAAPPQTLEVAGEQRELIAFVPDTYQPDRPMRLVVAFHGRTNDNAQVREYFDLEGPSLGEAIILYPRGQEDNGLFSWSDPGDLANALRDAAFFDALLDSFASSYCLDLDHVYLVGHSLGALFANDLACSRADEIRAIGTLGGSISLVACAGPLAAAVFHNPEDNLVAFDHGLNVKETFAGQNRCESVPLEVQPRALNCQRYYGCANDNAVLWCPHEVHELNDAYLPHHWPSSVGETIWSFFRSLD